MGKFEHTIEVKSPPEKAFKFIADGTNSPQWHPSIRKAERVSEGQRTDACFMRQVSAVKRRGLGKVGFRTSTARDYAGTEVFDSLDDLIIAIYAMFTRMAVI